jgi:cytochrome c oxidase assembly protein subunit 15
MLKNTKYETFFYYWIASLILLLSLMIIVGGLTRLTDSGLSITQWQLFSGILPPLNEIKWEYYFSLYKEIPQYILVNNNITIEDFKIIYLWEYAHRLLGRFIGLFFLLPLIYLIYKKVFVKKLKFNLIFIFCLILFQGFLGWYMVKSGLVNNVSVSHYRLSMHLSLAFIILSSLVWIYMNYVRGSEKLFFNKNKNILSIQILFALIFCQIILGAFVSGLDAGKIYQTWPLMNSSFFPDDVVFVKLIDYLNFNNHSLVQFFHRNLAYIIFFLSIYIGFKIFKINNRQLLKTYLIFFIIILLQIFLGIMVLLSGAHLYLASLHQISSIFLIISSLNLYHRSIAL